MEKKNLKPWRHPLRFDEATKRILERRATDNGVSVAGLVRVIVGKAVKRGIADLGAPSTSPVKSWCYSMRIDDGMQTKLEQLAERTGRSVAVLIRDIVTQEVQSRRVETL